MLETKVAGTRKGRMTKEQLIATIKDGVIDTVIIAFTDMQGRLMGKRYTGDFFLESHDGTHFCIYLLGTDMEMNTPQGYELMNWETGYGDWLARPDWSTLTIIPWLEKTALVLSDVVDEKTGQLIPVAPRNLLKNQLEQATDLGLSVRMASELEFYLLQDTFEEIHEKGYDVIRPAGHYNEDYNLLQATRNEPIFRKIRNYMIEAGIPVESSKGEAWIGQHEVNLKYADALTSADRHTIFKHGTKEICMQNGYAITFMAKPNHEWTGSGGHLHISLLDIDSGMSRFFDPNGGLYNMSAAMRHFLGGVIAYTRDFCLFYGSTINSYKRFASESWAPVNVAWSHDNRTSGYRVVGDGQSLRIENRIPGAEINPYLAYTAMIGSGLYGIKHQIEPPAELKGNAYDADNVPRVPTSLQEALALWEASPVVREVLGETVAKHYAHMARIEQRTFDSIVTVWERERYLEQG